MSNLQKQLKAYDEIFGKMVKDRDAKLQEADILWEKKGKQVKEEYAQKIKIEEDNINSFFRNFA